MEIFLLLYLIFVVAPISTFIHELGHLIGAKLSHANNVVLTIGSGKQIFSVKLKSLELRFNKLYFIGGYVNSTAKEGYTYFNKITIALCGPLNNIIFACFIYFISMNTMMNLIQIMILFNLWLACINLIPFKLSNRKSDGYTILLALRQMRHE